MKSVNTDVAYDFIRKRILGGEYAPGASLMTELLSAEIGISRTPIRDALRKLEADGLVTIRAHLGANVKKMEVKEFREMCDLRLAVESHAAGLAALNRTQADLDEIHYALEGMRRLTESILAAPQEQPFLSELVREDARFHIAIMTAAKNDLMKKEILRLHLINRVMFGSSSIPPHGTSKAADDPRRRVVLAKHEEIYNAIVRGEAVAARSAMESHLQELIEQNLRIMTRTASGMMARELTPEELAYGA